MIQMLKTLLVTLVLLTSSLAFADSYDDFKAEIDSQVANTEKILNPYQYSSQEEIEATSEEFMMLYTRISSSSLSDRQKSELLGSFAERFGNIWKNYGEPYADVVRLPEGANGVEKALNKVKRFFAGTLRDVSSVLATIGIRVSGANPLPDDWKRNNRFKWGLGKMSEILNNAIDEKHEALRGAGLFNHLETMIEQLRDAEPNRWGKQTATMHTLYIAVTLFAMLDAWDPVGGLAYLFSGFQNPPTLMHAVVSVLLVTPVLSILINLVRQINSGGAVRGATRKLVKALKKYNDNAQGEGAVSTGTMTEALGTMGFGKCEAQFL